MFVFRRNVRRQKPGTILDSVALLGHPRSFLRYTRTRSVLSYASCNICSRGGCLQYDRPTIFTRRCFSSDSTAAGSGCSTRALEFKLDEELASSSEDESREAGGRIETPRQHSECPFPTSEYEEKLAWFRFEDLAKLRNYFAIENWSHHFDVVSTGGASVKQYAQRGKFGHDEYLTVIHVPGMSAEKYWASNVDLAYCTPKKLSVIDFDILWSGVHHDVHRQTQYQSIMYPLIGMARQYILHYDTCPRMRFEDFPHLCYSTSAVGLSNSDVRNDVESLQEHRRKSFTPSYLKWVCWQEPDGLHIVSFFGEDLGFFNTLVSRVQCQLVPGSVDAAVKTAIEYDEAVSKSYIDGVVESLHAHGVALPEK